LNDTRELTLRFVVDTQQDLTATDFVRLFECAEAISRHVFEIEAANLLMDLGFPEQERFEALKRIHRLGRRIPVPAQVKTVQRGSWIVEVLVPGAVLLFILRQYIHPVIMDAWQASNLRDRIVTFLRDRIFLGARRDVEAKAAESPRYGNLEVTRVSQTDADPGHPELVIRLERREVIEARIPDEELVQEFLRRLRQ